MACYLMGEGGDSDSQMALVNLPLVHCLVNCCDGIDGDGAEELLTVEHNRLLSSPNTQQSNWDLTFSSIISARTQSLATVLWRWLNVIVTCEGITAQMPEECMVIEGINRIATIIITSDQWPCRSRASETLGN